jgi:hypothetical protein
MDAAKRADHAIRETTTTYLKQVRVDLDFQQIEKSICEKPLTSAGIAAGAGFILGGGMATRPALALLATFGRKAARNTAACLVTGMLKVGNRQTRLA